MNRLLKTTILSAAVAAMALTTMPANARDWHRPDRHRGDAVAAGVLGLAAGAILGGAMSQPRPVYRYHDDYPRTYHRPVYRDVTYEPWSAEWYRACDARYRSFDPASGTFMGYDGRRHFCALN